jgi:hypothetical protein
MITGHALNDRKKENKKKNYFFLFIAFFLYSIAFSLYIEEQ